MEYALLALILSSEPNFSYDQAFVARFATPQACNAALLNKISLDTDGNTEYECRLVNASGEVQPREATGPVRIITGYDNTRLTPNQIIEFRGLNGDSKPIPSFRFGYGIGPY